MFGKSNTKGVSLSHENTSSSNPIINNNISISNCDNGDEKSIQVIEKQSIEDTIINNNQESIPQSDPSLIQSENNFLKAILNIYIYIYIGQKLYFSGKYIVCTLQELIELIQLITNGEVDIETEPFEVACCGSNSSYSKVANIWINKDGQRSIFKYSYSQFLSFFDEYKISLKVIKII